MIQVDFSFYQGIYGGTMIPDANAFRQPINKANAYLAQVMHRKLQDSDQEAAVKLCLCEISDLLYQDAQTRIEHKGREVKSENTDGYSVSYTTSADGYGIDHDVYATIRRNLSPTGLLYAGVNNCACECSNYGI